jgi:hypothetical protein
MNTTLVLYVLFPIAILAFGMLVAVVTGLETFAETPSTSPTNQKPQSSRQSEASESAQVSLGEMRSGAKADLVRKRPKA